MKNTDKQTLRYETITKSPEFLKAAENNKKSGVFYLALRVKPKNTPKAKYKLRSVAFCHSRSLTIHEADNYVLMPPNDFETLKTYLLDLGFSLISEFQVKKEEAKPVIKPVEF